MEEWLERHRDSDVIVSHGIGMGPSLFSYIMSWEGESLGRQEGRQPPARGHSGLGRQFPSLSPPSLYFDSLGVIRHVA
jgi:hypothetical protein